MLQQAIFVTSHVQQAVGNLKVSSDVAASTFLQNGKRYHEQLRILVQVNC